MAHDLSEQAEKLLDVRIPVLDKGFVCLVDYMGSDRRIVEAARVSYSGAGTKSYREDAGLIDYLLRNEHTSPFEQVVLTFHMKLPIFVARQMVRHRTARLNEISGRYSEMKDDFYIPDPSDVAKQSKDNKQGRENESMSAELVTDVISTLDWGQKDSYEEYQHLLKTGLARELARINLPLSLYTEWYWQIDLHNLFRFLALRLDPHAQKEIREYADMMLRITEAVVPIATKSFKEHILNGVKFSQKELKELQNRLHINNVKDESNVLTEKELKRFEEKLNTGKQL